MVVGDLASLGNDNVINANAGASRSRAASARNTKEPGPRAALPGFNCASQKCNREGRHLLLTSGNASPQTLRRARARANSPLAVVNGDRAQQPRRQPVRCEQTVYEGWPGPTGHCAVDMFQREIAEDALTRAPEVEREA
jgi:hypothetical protein